MRTTLTILVAVCALSLSSCQKEVEAPSGGVISVNGEWIKAEDVDEVANMLRQELLRYSPEGVLGVSEDLRRDAAKQLVANELMLQEAGKQGITLSPEQFESVYQHFVEQRFGGKERFGEMLTQTGQTEESVRMQIRQGIVVDSLVKSVLQGIAPVTDEECRAYYDKNVDRFSKQARARASQIFVKVDKDAPNQVATAAREKLQNVLEEARGGTDFAQLAKKHSQGPNASTGGDIGWFKRGDMMEVVDRAVWGLGKDEMSGVVASDAGLHIFKKTGEEMGAPATFSDVEKAVRNNLELKKRNDVMTAFIDSLSKAAKIVYADTSLAPAESDS